MALCSFSIIVLTAPTEPIAAVYRIQLRNLESSINNNNNNSCKFYCVADPKVFIKLLLILLYSSIFQLILLFYLFININILLLKGCRIGSGGGTLNALDYLKSTIGCYYYHYYYNNYLLQ